ncbi:MAG: antibiotic biosynthesis monooxygenase [Acidimicrobiales bacterium]|jgi:heme-degrading monooxygenase HmoA
MSLLLVELDVRPGEEQDLERAFLDVFRPAISAQPGFEAVALLRPAAGQRWLLEIRFIDEAKRLAWVTTDIHQKVWPEIDRLCEQVKSELFEAVT